uniref:TldD/PmbA family protein n=1 Tax=candidate division WOR-3 bacterium TaxID=2052148 RepID=A0A7V3RIB3_UNCW3
MMEKFLSYVQKRVDQAELYYYESELNHITFEDGKVKELEGTIQSGYSLRVIKDNTLGFAYTKNLNNPDLLLEGALNSLKAKTHTNLKFPENRVAKRLNVYDESIEGLDTEMIVNEGKRVIEIIKSRLNAKVDIHIAYGIQKIAIENSNGTEISEKFSFYRFICNIVFPNTASGIDYILKDKKFSSVPDTELNELIEIYQRAIPERKLKSGMMKVLFLPDTLYALLWRLASGTAGNNIYYKKSPLINKIGEKIFSEELTIYEDPHNDYYPFARSFDDEGTPTRKLMLIENGILKNFYYDLYYADKLGVEPTGNGYKSAMWGGEYAALKPVPSLEHTFIEPGKKSFFELIQSMDYGIIVFGVLGAHSGNIPNGDFSIGIEPCLLVEGGEITGRVKNTMIAGNIYDAMKNVIEIENKLHPVILSGTALPAILFDGITVVSS